MADPPPCPDSDIDSGGGPDRGSTGMPRWVKVFGIIAIVLVLLVLILMVAGGGEHGPGRHTPSLDRDSPAPPVEEGV